MLGLLEQRRGRGRGGGGRRRRSTKAHSDNTTARPPHARTNGTKRKDVPVGRSQANSPPQPPIVLFPSLLSPSLLFSALFSSSLLSSLCHLFSLISPLLCPPPFFSSLLACLFSLLSFLFYLLSRFSPLCYLFRILSLSLSLFSGLGVLLWGLGVPFGQSSVAVRVVWLTS